MCIAHCGAPGVVLVVYSIGRIFLFVNNTIIIYLL